ncbi:MAG: M56 family metallopeptidase [Calditrichia bacterium]
MNSTPELITLWREHFLQMNVNGSLFILLVLLISVWLARKNDDPRLQIILMGIALVKLFVPIIALPVESVLPGIANRFELPEVLASSSAGANIWTVDVILFCLWLTGVIVLSAKLIFRTLTLRSKLKNAALLPHTIDLPANTVVLLSAEEQSPLVTGLFRHKILLPASSKNWNTQVKRTIITHELQHIQAGDHWINVLQIFSQIIFFFNPMVWLLNNRINLYREISCDNRTIRNMDIPPRDYANNLIHIAESLIQNKKRLTAASYFSQCQSGLSKRIHYQLKKEVTPLKKHILSGFGIAAAVLLLAIPFSCSTERSSATASEAIIVDINNLSVKPKLAVAADLKYPEDAKKAALEGTVVVDILVNAEGNVMDAKVVKSVPELDAAALEFVRTSTFSPGEADGKAVSTRVKLPIKFKLN